MTEVRQRSWLAIAGLLALLGTPGCGCSDDGDNPSVPAGGTGGSSGSAGSSGNSGTGGGGAGGSAGTAPEGGGSIGIQKAVEAPSPFDATPDPEGKTVYYTAIDPTLGPGVFKVPVGGGTPTTLHAGAPFAGPFGIATSTIGSTLYVADPASEWTDMAGEPQDGGQIFALSANGGPPTTVAGTEGRLPRGLEVHEENSADVIFYSGRDQSGAPGVFKIASGGGTSTAVASGAPFVDPGGIAVAANGDVYVADTSNAEDRSASVLVIKGGVVSVFASDVSVGFPAGIALAAGDGTLFVSGLDPETSTDLVLAIDTSTKAVSRYTGSAENNIALFNEPAGLHRAKKTNVFAWADSKANSGGTVYTLTLE
jgi:hypothetical protein